MPDPSYEADGLTVYDRNVGFLADPRFRAAYRRGMDSGHHIRRAPGSTDDIHLEWRVHVVLWAASLAARLPGDFVECGVNTGIFSLAVCDFLDFNATGKSFWLFDTFAGIPPEQVSDPERQLGRRIERENRTNYGECFALAHTNFAAFPRAHPVRGKVPDTLTTVDIERVAYLSIDMNIAEPEVAAMRFFWDKLSVGAPVLLDDYGRTGHRVQQQALNELAAEWGVEILELPTGQGLLVKPPP